MSELFRPLGDDNHHPAGEGQAAAAVPLPAWLDLLQLERDTLIARLRGIDAVLIANGRLSHETIPRRIR